MQFLSAFAQLQEAVISSLSAWNNSALTGWILMKFDIWVFFENLWRNFHFFKIKQG